MIDKLSVVTDNGPVSVKVAAQLLDRIQMLNEFETLMSNVQTNSLTDVQKTFVIEMIEDQLQQEMQTAYLMTKFAD